MTEAEKKMKKYCNAVERRLNLPLEVKARVMTDFSSSIAARREAGKTDEEIYAELGTPKEAAAILNEQMKEFAYRKSPWRFAFIALAVYGAWELLGTIIAAILMFFLGSSMASVEGTVGVIGGADGPTAIFVTTVAPTWFHYAMPAVLLIVGILGYWRLKKCKQK